MLKKRITLKTIYLFILLQVEKEKKAHEKEKRERERLQKKAEKLAEKASRKK